jgi:hypothetical protein
MDPRSDEERPRKRDDGPDTCDCNKAISCNATIRLDDVVEPDRWRLHETERHHCKTDL